MPNQYISIDPYIRFLSKLTRMPNGCLEYMEGKDKDGYGKFWLNGKTLRAHHAAWFFKHHEMPHLCVLHKCDNPRCCDPEHLFLGTNADNMADKVSKGRQPSGDAMRYMESRHRGSKHFRTKLTEEQVIRIREIAKPLRRKRQWRPQLAAEFGISVHNLADIIARRTWTHI